LADVELMLDALEHGVHANPRAILGGRGLGKTVLLGAISVRAKQRGWKTSLVSADNALPLEQHLPTDPEGSGVLLMFDDVDKASENERRALAIALHALSKAREVPPIATVMTGQSQLDVLGMGARAYSERMLELWELASLSFEEVAEALQRPAEDFGRRWEEDALEFVVRETRGHPLLVQLWGDEVWTASVHERLTLDDVQRVARSGAFDEPTAVTLSMPIHRPDTDPGSSRPQ
jgi:chromosomal replication initiation ATPase DnaA